MTDDKIDIPWTLPVPGEEETQKPLQNIVAKRWWYAMLVAGVIPLLLVFGSYEWYSSAFGWSMFIGMPSSFVAIFITSWWRLGLIYQSLTLLACNIVVFLYIFRAFVIMSC